MSRRLLLCCAAFAAISGAAGDVAEPVQFHDDYYEGFAQGVYYGLLLNGEAYDSAWCMKAELGYEAKTLGGGGEFQESLEELLALCRQNSSGSEQGP